MIDILFVVLPGTLLLDLAGPAEAFRLANQRLVQRGQACAYRLRYTGPCAEAATSVGATLAALEPLPATLAGPTRVVLLGQPSGAESPLRRPLPRAWTDTRRWLAQVVAPQLGQAASLVTVCAGALLAADAGLLGSRRCTTHHEMLADLQRLAPAATVLANRVFVIDGPLASSAGITAGIDLALHLIALDLGDAMAAAVGQVMVVYLRRGPEDPELSPLLAGRNHLHPAVHRVQDALCGQPDKPWSLQAMAEVAHVTPRHLSRLFSQHVGCAPRQYLQAVRVALAHGAMQGGQPRKQALAAAGIAGDRQWRRLRPAGRN
ncbi:MAG: DJ-1/PfpI family protein [Rubrivivax sp.]|nr:DJ-1/PfpI family protein [Rubrivivax sp.]